MSRPHQLDPMEAGRFLDTLAKLHEEFGVTVSIIGTAVRRCFADS